MSAFLEWLRDSPFATSTWVDWLDIAILTWLIHRALMLIRGTRAQQSLIGLLLLLVVYAVADAAGLSTLRWVFDNLLVYFVLALLILFQDDIRNALATAGGSLFSGSGRRADANIIEEVGKAVFHLSQRKVGAIVVLERLASLDPYIEGAHQIDARISTELIQSLFHHSSPLHDGAVVVRGERLVAAGVFLPLTLSKDISRAYGTRHRAAIGLTESTDALCLVVSEERGTVSLVQNGVISPVADLNDLRERLQQGLEVQVEGPTSGGSSGAQEALAPEETS